MNWVFNNEFLGSDLIAIAEWGGVTTTWEWSYCQKHVCISMFGTCKESMVRFLTSLLWPSSWNIRISCPYLTQPMKISLVYLEASTLVEQKFSSTRKRQVFWKAKCRLVQSALAISTSRSEHLRFWRTSSPFLFFHFPVIPIGYHMKKKKIFGFFYVM